MNLGHICAIKSVGLGANVAFYMWCSDNRSICGLMVIIMDILFAVCINCIYFTPHIGYVLFTYVYM